MLDWVFISLKMLLRGQRRMSRSNLHKQGMSGLPCNALLIAAIAITTVLSGCDGGLFGTGTGEDNDVIAPIASADTEETDINEPGTGDTASESETTGSAAESPSGSTTDSDSQSISTSFSNTTPSGIDTLSVDVPSLKLINLTDFALTVTTMDNQSNSQSVDVAAQSTSELLSVNTGESVVGINTEDNGVAIASINPLNASSDSLTTLIIDANSETVDSSMQDTSLLALDTRAVVSASGMAELRIISTPGASPELATSSFTLTPLADDNSGAELVLSIANAENAAIGTYSLANAGDYLLSTSDGSFSPVPITLSTDVLYTLIITANPQAPVYVEVDSLSADE